MRLSPTTRSGFTLVELLVVIGIIAVLISVLLPALSKARQQAVSVQCKAALQQYGVGWTNYAVAHKGAIYTGIYSIASMGPPLTVISIHYSVNISSIGSTVTTDYDGGFLSPYMKPMKTARNCPLLYNLAGDTNISKFQTTGADQFPVGYAFSPYTVNSNPKTTSTGTQNNKTIKLSMVKMPAETFFFADSAKINSNTTMELAPHSITADFMDPPGVAYNLAGGAYNSVEANRANLRLHGRHTGGTANVLWFDGHVTSEVPNYTNTFVKDSNTPARRKQLKIGDLMPPGTVYGDEMQNYYFCKDKKIQR